MNLYNVKLTPWASPCIVQATSAQKAKTLALFNFPKCDCCGAPSVLEYVERRTDPVPMFQSVICEVIK